jgi:hypothetical protein
LATMGKKEEKKHPLIPEVVSAWIAAIVEHWIRWNSAQQNCRQNSHWWRTQVVLLLGFICLVLGLRFFLYLFEGLLFTEEFQVLWNLKPKWGGGGLFRAGQCCHYIWSRSCDESVTMYTQCSATHPWLHWCVVFHLLVCKAINIHVQFLTSSALQLSTKMVGKGAPLSYVFVAPCRIRFWTDTSSVVNCMSLLLHVLDLFS